MWNGYFADIGRTTIIGKPSKQQKTIYTAVYEGLMAGVEKMRPGFTNIDAAEAIINKVGDYGLAEHMFSLFIGHGIGHWGQRTALHRRNPPRCHRHRVSAKHGVCR